jgi:hypothetical protein
MWKQLSRALISRARPIGTEGAPALHDHRGVAGRISLLGDPLALDERP